MNAIATTHPLPRRPRSIGIGARLARFTAPLRRALEASARVRGERHLLEFADRCESQQPELAKELRMAVRRGASE